MSDLDADLYGDLYGNDEADFVADAKDLSKQELEDFPPAEDENPEPEQSPAPVPSSLQTSVKPQVVQTTPATPVQKPQAVQSYSSNSETQQIPTYQERTEYSMPSPPRQQNGNSQYIPVSEHRSVRPSEMKDEG
ncbi:hypothetical protein NEOLEDRAFT_561441 [Neolentinus lepideus HHB14362 ss-1]|uniref:Uncharacterized protein n=1 Tax=Neolentinus lepideus HHB14362 ss-1 TaxID=1314782 RepID=A0A165R1R1_9AGAM|nr:hypothetical protein NEOLEDRAFT_561441 [Neolentinus lepideus HHB14362 ss-1]